MDDIEAKEIIHDSLSNAIELFYQSEIDQDEVMDLIPVKPIGDYEEEINSIYEIKLMGLFRKIGRMPAPELL